MTSLGIRVTGTVQGVGFRPFVARIAERQALTGFVANDAAGVNIEVHGSEQAIERFLHELQTHPPRLADIQRLVTRPLEGAAIPDSFEIKESEQAVGRTAIPPDTAVCEACLEEMRDPRDRRYRYPLIACTDCGPRFTITTGLPYDREHTTMAEFPLCQPCRIEYEDPRSRRYHAQPTACPDCGPAIDGGDERLQRAARELREGSIVAIKGIGGYHLACDAADPKAVAKLRARKGRGDKPFAIMARDLQTAEHVAQVDESSAALLHSPAAPIVVLRSRDKVMAGNVAPGNDTVGVMLPYSGIHHLLFEHGAPPLLVMTSGNLSDEPICTEPAEAEARLSEIADSFVHHNRSIYLPCDDSVLRIVAETPQPIRRSRGIVPAPLPLPVDGPMSIAVGAELKAAACISDGEYAWLSQHIGDTADVVTLRVLQETIDLLCEIERVRAERIISDLHPGYLSSRWAFDYAQEHDIEHLAVQHHHAHMASLLVEHNYAPDEPVLAISFDGTGYGLDGSMWGGELLLGSYREAERVGHLAPIALPGGDAATKHPARSAAAHLHSAGVQWDPRLPPISALGEHTRILASMLASGASCVTTTSAGRLFDAVSALLGVCQEIDYEGQAAIELEARASERQTVPLELPLLEVDGVLVLDSGTLIAAITHAVLGDAPIEGVAAGFHDALAKALTEAAVRLRERHGVRTVGLTGGVFANRLLTERLRGRLIHEGFGVLVHHVVPPNDGGLALGQVAVANAGGASPWRPA